MKEDIIEKEGKLVFEYNGARYSLEIDEATGDVCFKGDDQEVTKSLRRIYSRFLNKEVLEADESGDYWYERPYVIGLKVAESVGAKILEHEYEVYKKCFSDGTPILY